VDLLARTLTAALLAVILIALAATSADATHTRGKCKQRGTTVVKNDSARVYERGATLYGCAWSRDVEQILDTENDDFYTTATYGKPILRGRFVAWVRTEEDVSCKADCPPGYDATDYILNVFDVRGGDSEATTVDPMFGTLKLNSRGASAWLEFASADTQHVNAWEWGAEKRRLDTGPIRRFRLRGRTLSWLNGAVQRSAALR
jgi:hypothetical protein